MTPGNPLPTPRVGQRWIGGANGGHTPSTVEITRVAKNRVRVRFVDGPYRGKLTYLYRYQFVVQFRPLGDRS